MLKSNIDSNALWYGFFFYQMLIYITFNSRNCLLYIEYQTVSRTNIANQWHLFILIILSMYYNPMIKQITQEFNHNRQIK